MKTKLFLMLLMSIFLSACWSDQTIEALKVNPNPDTPPDPGELAIYVSDIQYEWVEIIGGGPFPTDTIHHVDTRAWVEVKKKGKPRLTDYERIGLLPHPKARATKFLRKRNWR